jgi:histidinol dehydrogenase
VLVIADGGNDPAWIAADLLAQAEHDTAAQSILVTDSPTLADAIEGAVAAQLATLPRADIAAASWRDHGAVILVDDLGAAVELANRIAAEHLELAVDDPEALLPGIRNAGAVFLGRYTPEVIGDYVGGPNHVLPTARSARFSSGLSVYDFLKRTTILGMGPDQLRALAEPAIALAEAEGLAGHARSVAIRLNRS